jgi:hypothetical protein
MGEVLIWILSAVMLLAVALLSGIAIWWMWTTRSR